MKNEKQLRVIVLSEEVAWRVTGALDNANSLSPCPMYAEALAEMKRAMPSPIWVEEDVNDRRRD